MTDVGSRTHILHQFNLKVNLVGEEEVHGYVLCVRVKQVLLQCTLNTPDQDGSDQKGQFCRKFGLTLTDPIRYHIPLCFIDYSPNEYTKKVTKNDRQ